MRNVSRIFIGVYFLCILGCSSLGTEIAWQKARQANTLESYQAFLESNPSSELSAEAKKRIEELEWSKAEKTNTRKSYSRFLQLYPQSPQGALARKRLERMDWNRALKIRSTIAYERYLRQYPNGTYRTKALAALEQTYWLKARRMNSMNAYQDFLQKYPGSKYGNEARQRMEKLVWVQTKALGSTEAIENFLKENPGSTFREVAKKELYALTWKMTRETNTRAAYREFITQYPQGSFSHDAYILGSIKSLNLSFKEYSAKSMAASPFGSAASSGVSKTNKKFLVAHFIMDPLKTFSLTLNTIKLVDANGKTIPAQDISGSTWLVAGDKAKKVIDARMVPGKISEFDCMFAVGKDALNGAYILLDNVKLPVQALTP